MPPKGFFNDGREKDLHEHIMSLPAEPLRNNPQAIVDAMDAYIKSHTRMMTFQPPKITLSRRILEKMEPKPKILVELGCYVGMSALSWGAMLKDFNGEGAEGVKVYTCELSDEFAAITRDFIKLAGLDNIVEVVVGKSTDSLHKLLSEGSVGKGKLDVLFLDHWEDFYLPDLKVCEDLGLFRKGSVILADNTDLPGAPAYLEYVRKGGRGAEGGVEIKTETLQAVDTGNAPKAVEVTTVIGVA